MFKILIRDNKLQFKLCIMQFNLFIVFPFGADSKAMT